jgi:type VI secretion system protein
MRGADHVLRFAILVAWLTAVIELAACSTPSYLCWFPSGVKTITLVTQPDTNADRAIAVDLVFVTDDLPAKEISRLSASDYFARRAQLLMDFPEAVQIRSWELAPGQLVKQADTNPPCNLVGTYIFAGYATQGDHRAAVGKVSSLLVRLGAKELTVTQ